MATACRNTQGRSTSHDRASSGPTPARATWWKAPRCAPWTRPRADRKSTRLNSSHLGISYAVFCLKKKKKIEKTSLQERAALRAISRYRHVLDLMYAFLMRRHAA